MLRVIFLFIMLFFSTVDLAWQQDADLNVDVGTEVDIDENLYVDQGSKNKSYLGEDYTQGMHKILIDDFESPLLKWKVRFSRNYGIAAMNSVRGYPIATNKESTGVNGNKATNERVLGVKVHFERRAHLNLELLLKKPMKIEGLPKDFSVWVSGRKRKFKMYALISDITYHNNMERLSDYKIYLGLLKFLGWRNLNAPIPSNIIQYQNIKSLNRYFYFKGFVIQCNAEEAIGDYYMYLDNPTIYVSRLAEDYHEPYDPVDVW